MPHRFKIYGLFRSGTNLLRHLVEEHLDARCDINEGGHKHLFTPQNWTAHGYVPQPVDMLVCVKDPYAAMESLFRYAQSVKFRHFRCAQEWEEFLHSRFVVAIDRQPQPPAFRFRDPVDYWNAVYYHMVSVADRPLTIVRYEDMLADPDRVLAEIGERHGVAKTGTAVLPARQMKKMTEQRPDDPFTGEAFDPAWYRDRLYLRAFDERQMAHMRAELDAELAARLGYQVIS